MDRAQTSLILAILKSAYPHAFKDMTSDDAKIMRNLWEQMFADDPYEEVNNAVRALIATRTEGYTPTIGEVKEQIRRRRDICNIDESTAWMLVSKACRNGLYGSRQEFDKLPEEVKQIVGSPEQLKQWAAMDAEVVESVVASNFKKAFRVQAERNKEIAKLPQNMREAIGAITNNMKLINGVEE